jgi:dynein heavy chain
MLRRYGAPVNKKVVFFIDDVNMPARERYGAQPPIELLRQFQDFKGFYDRKKLFWKDVEDTVLCAACAPPGGGRQEVTSRCVGAGANVFHVSGCTCARTPLHELCHTWWII